MDSETENLTSSPAEPVLRADPSLSNEERADLFDAFHSKDPSALVSALHSSDALPQTKIDLLAAKHLQPQEPEEAEELDPVSGTLQKMRQMDPETLALADKFPAAFKEMVKVATKPKPAEKRVPKVAVSIGGPVVPPSPEFGENPPEGTPSAGKPGLKGWVKFVGQDGKNYTIHPDDLAEAKKRGLVKKVRRG